VAKQFLSILVIFDYPFRLAGFKAENMKTPGLTKKTPSGTKGRQWKEETEEKQHQAALSQFVEGGHADSEPDGWHRVDGQKSGHSFSQLLVPQASDSLPP
jgi:hypothetical protein